MNSRMTKKIAILNYGLGNIRSVNNAVVANGAIPIITDQEHEIMSADGLIVPGVGAFPRAMEYLERTGLDDVIRRYVNSGKGILGICLGMQILFENGDEYEPTDGLSLIPGNVCKISTKLNKERLPHIKWSHVDLHEHSNLMFSNIAMGTRFYFVHSYAAINVPCEFVAATVNYGSSEIIAAVVRDNIWGTQFHPEKSGPQGLSLLNNFIKNC